MRGFVFFISTASMLASGNAHAGTPDKVEKLDSVVVSASRAGKSTPVTFTMVDKEELRRSDPSHSLPMVLSGQPSVVVSNEGGTGLGYSKMTVRGSKGSQINVTLNGITLNDSESQEVFWVNIPSLPALLSSVQLQRGLGTSSNGAGAFGASINMSTASVGASPYGSFEASAGSYGTFTSTVSAGTGLLPSGMYASAAYSRGVTDGYIRNAFAGVQSAFAALGWLKGNNSLRVTYLMGSQRIGITWNGIPESMLGTNRRYNPAGAYKDKMGNVRYYDNETDNYAQHHIQLNYTHRFQDALTWSSTVNFTKGDGYYEQYEAGKKFGKYGLPDTYVHSDGNTYKESDMVVRKQMDNYYLVLNSNVGYVSERLDLTAGLYISRYDGGHFGDVIWSDVLGDDYDYSNARWYSNKGLKHEANVFLRGQYNVSERLTAYADLQYRGVSLVMKGPDDNFIPMDYEKMWHFFNPRTGLTFRLSPSQKLYASAALGHREPGRSDLKEDIESVYEERKGGSTDAEVKMKPEKMVDIELGYVYQGSKFTGSANIYFMEYKDMLIETGKLSPVGYAIKENVPRSWRRGIEVSAAWMPLEEIRVEGNMALSMNQIADYTFYREHYVDNDNWSWLPQVEEHYGRTTMLMSPSAVAMARLSCTPFKRISRGSLNGTTVSLGGKYVGKQYWDNTQSSDRCIPAYFVADLSLVHTFSLRSGELGFSAHVNNLLNNLYYADAWVYRPLFDRPGDTEKEYSTGVFPQAPVNFNFKVFYRF